MRFLLDASAIIEWGRNNPKAVEIIMASESIGISSIAAYEVLVGLPTKKRSRAVEFFISYGQYLFRIEDVLMAAEIRDSLKKAGKTVNSLDIMIAAQAKRLNFTVLAKDEHFDTIKNLCPEVSVMQIEG